MAIVTSNEYDHIDVVNGSNTNRHYIKDTTARNSIENLKSIIDEIKTGAVAFELVNKSYVNSSTGAFVNYTATPEWSRTGYVRVFAGDILTITTTRAGSDNAFYNAQKGYVSGFSLPLGTSKLTIPSGVSYMAISSRSTDMANLAISSSIANSYVTPEMYGAFGDGEHDDTTALQTAITGAATNHVPIVLNGAYCITTTIDVSGTIIGTGKVLEYNASNRIQGAFFETAGDTYIDGITFDCYSSAAFGVDDKFTDYNVGVIHTDGALELRNCTFKRLYNGFVLLKGATGDAITTVEISGCVFNATNKSNRFSAYCIAISNVIKTTCVINITGNRFYGYVGTDDIHDNACAVIIANTLVKGLNISNNIMENMGRLATYDDQVGYSRMCAIDVYFNAQNVVIDGNKLLNCNWTPIRLHGIKGAKITNNEISIAKYINEPMVWISDSPNSTGEAPVGTDDVVIANNVLYSENTHTSAVFQINSVPRHETEESALTNITVANNTVQLLRSEYIILLDNSVKSCAIKGNRVKGDANTTTVGVSLQSGNYAESEFMIDDNTFDLKGTCIDASAATSPAKITITGNNLNAVSGNCVKGNSNTSNVYVIGNVLFGDTGVLNALKAIDNVSFCSTHYSNVGEEYGNYPGN